MPRLQGRVFCCVLMPPKIMLPSCDQKRALMLAYRLNEEVLAEVPHRQWVFTIPKRLRVYFRYDRKLLGKLCRAAYDTVREIFEQELDGDCGVSAMVATAQTSGNIKLRRCSQNECLPSYWLSIRLTTR